VARAVVAQLSASELTAAVRADPGSMARLAAGRREAGSDRAAGQFWLSSNGPPAAVYPRPVTCRLEVFVRSGHTIDLALEDGEDRVFVSALHEAWASPDAIEFKHLALGQHAVILAGEVVGYRLHGSVRPGSAL